MRFLIVIHGWHVTSRGFDVHEINVKNEKEAYDKSILLREKRSKPFDECAAKVIAIEDNEKLVNRKLTWKERITGKLKL